MLTLNMWMKAVGMDENRMAQMLFAIIKKEQRKQQKNGPPVPKGQFTCTDEYEEKFRLRKTSVKPKPVTQEEIQHRAAMWAGLNGGSAPKRSEPDPF